MTTSANQAKRVALVSLILSIVFFFIAFLVGQWSGFYAVFSISWLILSAAFIWFVLCLQFHLRALAEQEKLDTSQLVEGGEETTIFQSKGERSVLFAVAQRRLDVFEKWFLPFLSSAIAIYQIAIGLGLLRVISTAAESDLRQPLICAICMTAIAFISFLMSRYATGMSVQLQWKPLRAGGSIFLGTAVLCFVLAIALAMAQFQIFVVVDVISYLISILFIIFGVETALNVVLDVYRPRLKGQYSRSAFDSRLLGIINEPGRIARTAASAIDYQFGFEVSQTWFYKLLEKAIVPLILFVVAALYLMSCVVVVNPDEQVLIERFGNPIVKTGEVRIVGPGLIFKWPWPVDIVYKYPVKRVAELNIGFVPKEDPETGEVVRGPLLWGKAHYEEEYSVLVASEQTGGALVEGAVPVSVVKANVPVQYRVKDLYAFLYNHKDPQALLESICYRELAKFAASAKIEVDDEDKNGADLKESLLGAGRAKAKRVLTDRIQLAADEMELGVEIVFLGLQGIHPPPELAADYQKVVGAVQKKQADILKAQAYLNRSLSSIAGSVEDAERLYDLVAQYQLVKEEGKSEEIEEVGHRLDSAFAEARGDIFGTLRQAKSYAFEKITLTQATGRRFASQLKAYEAAKDVYKREQRLLMFEEALEGIRKFLVVADKNDMQVFVIDVKDKLTPSLYELAGLEENRVK